MRLHPILALVAGLLLSACATAPKPQITDAPQPLAYALDSGDVLRVSVYGDTEISGEYRIGDGGDVSIPLVGSVVVRGQTTKSAAARVAAALANGYMRNPDVAVEVTQYRPFFIEGAVTNSGQFSYVPNLSVRAAVSMAGGFTETADRQRVAVHRRQGDKMVVLNLNLDQAIAPGDVVTVGQRWF
ncbi:polysaccharide biosynthesis/export family protein [Devosia sp. 2618]|uniref:polysaccharide biosynthesis/export family protein n=1 Tax=Devosia sp. 2618 TaxID=3156454 RepID=UPI003399029C